MNPEVSIILPTYYSEAYVAKALNSLLAQTYDNFEVILVDDASGDRTVEIARRFADKRLKIVQNKENRGVSYSRNLAISLATGNWIALLDSDDWYEPTRLDKLLALAKQTQGDLIADDLKFYRDEESRAWGSFMTEGDYPQSPAVSLINSVKFAQSDRLKPIGAKRNWSLGYLKPLMRREFLLQNKIRYDENIKVGEDFILYLDCLRQGAKFYLLSEAYYCYRTRITSLSCRQPSDFLEQSCEITTRFIDLEVRSQEESLLLQALLVNLKLFQQRIEYYRVVESIKQKQLWLAVKLLIDRPYITIDLGRQFLLQVKNKLRSVLRIGVEQNEYRQAPKHDRVAYSER